MKVDNMKRCTKCVLPETYPDISFDEDGVCTHCQSFQPIVYKGETALREVFKKSFSQSEWDCLVPLSGGRDSTYTLYQLVNKYGLRALAYNYDNGFVENVARDNIQNIADRLKVEVVYRKSEEDLQCKNIKYLTEMNIKKSPGHVQAFLCSGCRNGIWGGAHQVAREKNIPLVIFGESSMESGGFKKILSPKFTPTATEKLSFLLRMPLNFYHRKKIYRKLEKEFPSSSTQDSKVTQVNFFDYEEWNEESIMSVIQKELDWQHKSEQSSWRFDCQIHALVNRMVYQLFGMTEKDELYSKLIREGQITREQALEYISANEDEKERELEIIDIVLERMNLNGREKDIIRSFCQGSPKFKNSWE